MVGASNPGFGSPAGPAFGSVGGPSQTSAFGQTPAFGPQSVFGQELNFGRPSSGFGQKLSGFGQQAAGFGNTQSASGATASLGPPRQLGFGQSVFGQAPTTAATSNVFAVTQTQSRGFGSEFSFKPASEVLFKPIYSGSPEPLNPQTTALSGLPFGNTAEKTSSSPAGHSSTITGFSGASSGSLAFSFSQPAAAPSLPVPRTILNNSGGPPHALQFTFSPSAAPSGSNTSAPTTQPKTPSTFSFSTKTFPPQTEQLFGGTAVIQPSAFSDNKSKAEPTFETKAPEDVDANVFAQLRKGMKRKEEPATTNVSSAGPEVIAKEDETAEISSPRQPPKRPLMRARGPAGLFSRALSGLRRSAANPVAKEAEEPLQQKPRPEEVTSEQPQVLSEKLTALQTASPPLLEKDEESGEISMLRKMRARNSACFDTVIFFDDIELEPLSGT